MVQFCKCKISLYPLNSQLLLDYFNIVGTFSYALKIFDTKILKTGGFFALEIGFDQAQDVLSIMETNFHNLKITKDLSGNDRVISGYLK